MKGPSLSFSLILAPFLAYVLAVPRILPPHGSIVVRAGTTVTGEFATINSALNSVSNTSSSIELFIYPGTYNEQVYINRTGPVTVYGFTIDTRTYEFNTVNIVAGIPASAVSGSNDASGTLRIHKDNFKMYNVNVKNTYGIGSQAIALSQYGSKVGLYACGFYGYQDTLLANAGTQVYLKGYIEGAIDFLFGRHGLAYFGGNTIGVVDAGYITANGRETTDNGSYVLDHTKIVLAPNATANTSSNFFLGRPWGDYATVIFKNTEIDAKINHTLWSIWDPGDERTDNVFFADFNTFGRGARNISRPSFATELTASQAKAYNISSAIGSDYESWVDLDYFV